MADIALQTTRFGQVVAKEEDVIHFSAGVFGFSDCRDWVLLADTQNSSLGWMQCLNRPEVAFAVVSPRRFHAEYQVRVPSHELLPLGLQHAHEAQVLVILSKGPEGLTLNLKAPLVINLERRLGRQLITGGDYGLQHPVEMPRAPLRKSA